MNENMKPSGISWIGDIPESWSVQRLKYLGVARNGLTYDPNDISDEGSIVLRSMNVQDGMLCLENIINVNMSIPQQLVLQKNDLLICSRNGSRDLIGKCALIDERAVGETYGAFMCVYRSIYNRFLYYVMQSPIFSFYLGTFLTSTINQLTNENLGNIKTAFTSSAYEQKLIADFLDEQCKKIDSIATDIEKQIEIFQKYKKSLITETVTKGLDKSVSMKDSGIEWIGGIPEHYSLVPLKNLFWMYAGGDVDEYDFSDERTDKYKYAIYSNSLENNGLFGYMSKYRFMGDTITVTGRGDVGKALPRYDAYYPIVRLLVCVPQKKLSVSFFSYCINCADILGDQTAMAQLTTQKLGVVKVPVPTYDEQTQIAKYLDKQCSKIDDIIENKKEQLTKIQQHKKSLIYEYVTGKKRVKGAYSNGN